MKTNNREIFTGRAIYRNKQYYMELARAALFRSTM
jgi:hypothetical protein